MEGDQSAYRLGLDLGKPGRAALLDELGATVVSVDAEVESRPF